MTGSRLIQWHPHCNNVFVQYLNQLELCTFEDFPERRVVVHKSCAAKSLSSIKWQNDELSGIIACGSFSGSVTLVDWRDSSQAQLTELTQSSKSKQDQIRRTCHDVAWNFISTHKLACGFDSTKNSDSTVFVWDLQSVKLSKLKITDSCTSVSWLPNHESVLLAGTHNGWLKIFDVRAGSSPCLTAHAHPFHKPRKVKGVRPNFFESSIVATFSDGQGDVVKVWDLRQVDKSKKTLSACYQINPHLANFPYTLNNSSKVGVVNDCSWSPIRTFSLAVSTSINPTISLFHCDMNKFDNSFEVNSNGHYATTNQPVNIVDAVDVVKSLSWCCASKLEPSRTFIDFGLSHVQDVPAITEPFFLSKSSTIDNQDQSLDKGRSIFDFQFDTKHNNNRLLAATINGLFDTDFRENSPFSLQGNIVLQSLSTSVVVRNNVLKLSNEYSDMKIINYLEDTALVQKHRASAGYSMDASINLDVLIDELDMVFKSLLRYNHDGRSEVVKCIFDLYKVWQWIDRYEVSNNLSRVSLRDCGVAKLFEDTENSNSGTALQGASTAAIHAATGAIHHYSIRRKIIKELCGWVDIPIQYQSSTSQLSSYGSEKSLSDDEDEPGNFTEDDGVYFEDDDMDETNISGGKKYQRNEDELYFEQKELLNILIEECLHDSFERAAVIALWHGELDLAVQILYNAIEEYSSRNKKIDKPLNQYESDINEELDEPKSVWDVPVTEEYMQLVTMVATCFAGYFVPFQMGNPSYKQKPKAIDRISWKTMCHHIILQLQNNIRKSAAYLLAGCQFLLMNYESSQEEYCSQLQHNTQGGKDQGYLYINENERSTLGLYSSILGNRDISIEDQISFASIYLQDEDFKQWAKEKQLYCMNEGLLQGLLFTGLLTKDGFEVLQSYVDKTNDIQSVALLSSRLFYHISDLDSNSSSKDSGQVQIKDCNDMELLLQSCKNWLFYYRSLLNEWELFTERAYLDLEIHQRLQKKKDTAQSTIKTSVPNNNSQNSRQQVLVKRPGGGSASGSVGVPLLCKPVFEDIFHSLRVPVCSSSSSKTIVNHPLYFSYIKLKCSFCGMALPLDDISMKKMDQLRSQKNILNCCPHCSKPLPRCYICQLQLGMANPYVQVETILAQRFDCKSKGIIPTKDTKLKPTIHGLSSFATKSTSDDLQLHFDKWFLFCQRCRHGGHTLCMKAWFLSEEPIDENYRTANKSTRICGVNGCSCECRWC